MTGWNCAALVVAESISTARLDRQFLPDRYGFTAFTRFADLPETRMRNYRDRLTANHRENPLLVGCTGGSERTDQTSIQVSG